MLFENILPGRIQFVKFNGMCSVTQRYVTQRYVIVNVGYS